MAWACGTCTYVNEENHLSCLMCTTVRPLASQVAAATDGISSSRSHSGSISPSGANRKQPSSSQQTKPATTTSAPANSFAALVSRGGSAPAPSAPPPTKQVQSGGGSSSKAPSNYTGLVGLQGFPGEIRELKADEKSSGGFHFVARHVAGHVTALEAFHVLDAECQPFSLKRVHVSYYEEKPGHKAAREVNGPVHNQPHIYARCFAEFYPAKGLPNLLHRLLGKCGEKLKISQHDGDWFSHAFITPYFVRGHRGKDGLEICPYASKLCFRSGCPMAHKPEGWGVVRFDGKRPEDSLSPEPLKQNKKKPAVVIMPESEPAMVFSESKEMMPIASATQSLLDADLVLQENIRLMEEARKRKEAEDAKKRAASTTGNKDAGVITTADKQLPIGTGKRLSCAGCGLDKIENNFAVVGKPEAKNYCKTCTEKGVPKVECPRCYLMKFRNEFQGQICVECAGEEKFGGPAVEEPQRISGRHHVKIDFEKGVILSRNEIIFMLESTIGRIDLLEFMENPENKTPIGCMVRFVNWDYSTMAPNVRNLIPPNGIRLQIDDHPQQPRVEQLLQLVPDTLTYHEFALLEASYRAS